MGSGEYDPFDLAGQALSAAERDRNQNRERAEEEADFRWLMGGKRGRAVVRRLLRRAGVGTRESDPWDPNALTMARNAGFQRFARDILALVRRVSPDDFLLLVKEQIDDDRERAGRGRHDPNS